MYFISPPLLYKKLFNKAIWSIPTTEKIIYLTFDDGPIPEVTPWVLDALKKYQAKATFFCIGDNVKKHPEIFQQIISEKHTIGNHTFNHLDGWKTKTKNYIRNIEQCNELTQTKLFRPPYGKIKPSQFSILNSQFSIIMWGVLSGDFDKKTSQEKCLKNTIENTKQGSIVVFHDSVKAKENLYYALPKFLSHFQQKGFSFKSIPFH